MNLEYRHLRWLSLIWDTDLTSKAKLVAAALADHMNSNHDIAWPSVERLVAMTSTSRQTVMRGTRELEESGWLAIERGGINKGTSRYQPIFPESIEKLLVPQGTSTGTTMGPAGTTVVPALVPQWDSNQSIESANNNKGGRFAPPTLDEVKAYCQERGNRVDAEEFVDHYTANGWMRGKTKIKDWKACVRTWERSAKDKSVGAKINGAAHRAFGKQDLRTSPEDKARAERDLKRLNDMIAKRGANGA